MRHNIGLELTVCFKSKWHAGSGESSFVTDRLIGRDAQNRPYIPGSTLKGVIRESCEKLSRTLGFPAPLDPHETEEFSEAFAPLNMLESPVDRIFGNKYQSGNLFFRDARLEGYPPYRSLREQSRICKYRRLGTARDQHLFSTQYAAPMTFKTRIDGHHEILAFLFEEHPPFAYCLLIAGIMATDRLGGDKSTGSGQIEISFDSVRYNGEEFSENMDTIFEYLDAGLYRDAREI
jgi:CRISPR/Cas system CSM-associated protein Csm3 (group 7 of RAMP superfamily)